MALEAQNNPFPSVLLVEGDPEALPDADPASGQRRLAVGTDHLLYLVDDSGVKHAVAGGLSDPMTTRGDIIVRNASNVTARLGRGSSGQVLSSNGTDVSWQTPSGSAGALVLLEQHTASSSATLDFTTFISSTYDDYQIEIINLIPATGSVDLYMRCSTDGGSTYDSGSNYGSALWRWHSGAGTGASAGVLTAMTLAGGDHVGNTTAWGGVTGRFVLFNPGSASYYKRLNGQSSYPDGTNAVIETMQSASQYTVTTAVNAVRFLFSSGNIASGTIRVYGIAK